MKAKELRGEHIGKSLTFIHAVYDFKYACWKDAIRTSPITMITHKKDLGVNVRVGPSEGHQHQAEVRFEGEQEVSVS